MEPFESKEVFWEFRNMLFRDASVSLLEVRGGCGIVLRIVTYELSISERDRCRVT